MFGTTASAVSQKTSSVTNLYLQVALDFSLHGAVPVVLNGIVGSAVQLLGDLRPAIALRTMLQQNSSGMSEK